MEDEREPTWDEAVAVLEAATPAEVVRKVHNGMNEARGIPRFGADENDLD